MFPAQVFPGEIFEIFWSLYFEEHLHTNAPDETPLLVQGSIWNLKLIYRTLRKSLYNIYFWKKLNSQIYAEFRTIYLKVAFSQTFADRRRHIKLFFAKILKTVKLFGKSSILDVWQSSEYALGRIRLWMNTPLDRFALDAPRQELAMAPVEKCLTATAWQNCH